MTAVLIASIGLPAQAAEPSAATFWLPWLVAALFMVAAGASAAFYARRRRNLRILEDAFDSLPHPRQVVDRENRVVRTTRAFGEYFQDAAGALPVVLEKLAETASAREELRHMAERAAQGAEGRVELPVVAESGGRLWLEVRAQPVSGWPGAVFWSAEDITARRQTQDTLAAEQARFVDLLDRAPVGFYSVDQDGRFLYVNNTLADWLDARPGDLTGGDVRLHRIVPAAGEAGAAPYCPFTVSDCPTGEAVHGEVTIVGSNGQSIQADITQEVVPGDTKGALTTRSVVRNLTRERGVIDALERSEHRFRRFFEQAPMGIALLDSNGCVSECNAAFAEMLDRPAPALIGRPFLELLHESDRDQAAAALANGSGSSGAPPVVQAREGETVCNLFATALEDANDQAGRVVHLIDATERKNLEEQFAQSQKMQAVGQLAGGIAHDFNNLLTAIIGFCDLLLLRHRPGDQSFADLMQVKQNANRAANLVRQLLAFSRQQTLRPTVLSVTDVLAELMHLLRRLIGENIKLDISHGRDLHPVKVDQGQLEQVIINLAVNARDAMADQGGRLSISTRNVKLDKPLKHRGEAVPAGDYVLIEMADTGYGIAKENLDRIFDPFFSTKELGAGTGLGLSTVYGIVKQTGGFIEVASKQGTGTTFRIYLPRHREAADEEVADAPEGQETRDLTGIGTVLLVEDEDAVRSFSARALRKKGYNVLEANSGEQALELLEERGEPIDLLITDVVMPQIDGPTLVEQVRAERPDLKVIFISGYTENSFRRHLDSDSGVYFLAKPFSLKQLAGIVKEVLHDGAA